MIGGSSPLFGTKIDKGLFRIINILKAFVFLIVYLNVCLGVIKSGIENICLKRRNGLRQ